MIEADKRKAVFLLHQEGMSIREIARRLQLSRNTVRTIPKQQGEMPTSPRKHKALMFWRYAAAVCIIDNTNLARLRGTGRNAVIVPEMEAFAKEHGFRFVCHEKGHANRKAGEERSFWTVETNFLPGRHFSSLED